MRYLFIFKRPAQSKVNNQTQREIKSEYTCGNLLCHDKKHLGAPVFENAHDIKQFPGKQTEQTLDKQQ